VIAGHKDSSVFKLDALRWTNCNELPRSFKLRSPSWILKRVSFSAYHAKVAHKIWKILEFELIDIIAEVAHVSAAIWMIFSLTYIQDCSICCPSDAIIIAVSDPEFEVVASIWREYSIRKFRVIA
jgi:hypothetical protein